MGKLVKEEVRFVTVQSPALGRLKVPRDQIERWERSDPPATESAPAGSSPPPPTPEGVKPEATPPATTSPVTWPPADGFDWLELKSGEWLRGRIKSIQNRKLEFDSDEMDDQSFDFKDVRRFVSPNPNFLMFEDRSTAVGRVEITRDQVVVEGARNLRQPRERLRGLSPGRPREINYWSGKLNLGASLRAGNTEQADFNVQANLQRRTPATRFTLDYLGNFSQRNGATSANNHRTGVSYDVLLTRRLYLRPVFAQFYRDPFQNLAYQVTAGTGVGYLLKDTARTEWDLAGGPAYQFTRFETVESNRNPEDGTPAFLVGTRFDTELTRRIDLILQYQAIVSSAAAGTVTLHLVNTLEVELTKVLDLDISLIWDRIQTPQTDTEGHTPRQDDVRLNVGIGVDF